LANVFSVNLCFLRKFFMFIDTLFSINCDI